MKAAHCTKKEEAHFCLFASLILFYLNPVTDVSQKFQEALILKGNQQLLSFSLKPAVLLEMLVKGPTVFEYLKT